MPGEKYEDLSAFSTLNDKISSIVVHEAKREEEPQPISPYYLKNIVFKIPEDVAVKNDIETPDYYIKHKSSCQGGFNYFPKGMITTETPEKVLYGTIEDARKKCNKDILCTGFTEVPIGSKTTGGSFNRVTGFLFTSRLEYRIQATDYAW